MKQTILIIEDDDALQLLMSVALENKYRVFAAKNGAQGLQMFESIKPDLIITDISMPEMNGYELIRTVRAQKSQTKIIAYSAIFAHQPDMDKAYDAGANLCLAKPITIERLESVIEEILEA